MLAGLGCALAAGILKREAFVRTRPRTIYLIRQVESLIRARLDSALRDRNLTGGQYTVLSLLDRPDPLSSAQVARRSFVTPQTANETIASLERKGLISRREDAKTRRILRLSLTDAGREALAACASEIDAIEETLFRGLAVSRQKALREALEHIVATAKEDAARETGR